jgi:hypothetical protein
MIIPVNGVDTLADYERRREYLDKNIRPVFCPACRKEKSFWRHGKYERKVFIGAENVAVHINRFKCGNCAIVVSCIFSFMVPYVRYASNVVSKAIQNFSEVETSYVEQASEVTDLGEDAVAKPSPTQIFRWVDRVARKAESLLFQLQKEFVMRNAEDLFNGFVAQRAPNQKKARSEQKKKLLQDLAEFVQMAHLFTANGADALLQIHAFFLCDVESLQAIFCGRPLKLPTPHSLQSVLC